MRRNENQKSFFALHATITRSNKRKTTKNLDNIRRGEANERNGLSVWGAQTNETGKYLPLHSETSSSPRPRESSNWCTRTRARAESSYVRRLHHAQDSLGRSTTLHDSPRGSTTLRAFTRLHEAPRLSATLHWLTRDLHKGGRRERPSSVHFVCLRYPLAPRRAPPIRLMKKTPNAKFNKPERPQKNIELQWLRCTIEGSHEPVWLMFTRVIR